MAGYDVVELAGTATRFHERAPSVTPDPAIWVHRVTAPSLVLGSSQRSEVVDRAAVDRAGVEVVRRRSGGGAVLLVPGEVSWIDVILPRGAPGWDTDVHRPMVWLGRHLVGVLADLGVVHGDAGGGLVVHDGPMRTTRWSRDVCFDGIGAGEVLAGDAKVVGISQRRTRTWARLQCAWYSFYDPRRLLDLLEPGNRPSPAELAPVDTLPPGLARPVAVGLARSLALG